MAGVPGAVGSSPGRSRELSILRACYDTPAVKVITGIRRCGKSFLLRQIRDELAAHSPETCFFDLALPGEKENFDRWLLSIRQDPAPSGAGGRGSGGSGENCPGARDVPGSAGVRGHVILDHLSDSALLCGTCRDLAQRGFSVFAACQDLLTHCSPGGDREDPIPFSELMQFPPSEVPIGAGNDPLSTFPSWQILNFLLRPLSFAGARELAALSDWELSLEDYLIWGGLPEVILRGRPESGEASAGNRCRICHTEELCFRDVLRKGQITSPKAFAEAAGFIEASSGSAVCMDRIREHLSRHRLKWPRKDPGLWLGALANAWVGECAEIITEKTHSPAPTLVSDSSSAVSSSSGLCSHGVPHSGSFGGNTGDSMFCFFAMDPALCSQYRGDGAWDLIRCARTVLFNEIRSRGYEVTCQDLGQGRMVFHAAAPGNRRFAAVLWDGRGGTGGLRSLLASVSCSGPQEQIILVTLGAGQDEELPVRAVSLENFLLCRWTEQAADPGEERAVSGWLCSEGSCWTQAHAGFCRSDPGVNVP